MTKLETSMHEHVAGRTLTHFPNDTPSAETYTKAIEYRFNAQGFRCDNDCDRIEPHTANMYLGCSNTLGIGVNLYETWCQRVNDRVGGTMLNMGQAGGAAETCYRLAAHWIPLVQPRAVYMLSPPATRREFWMSNTEVDIIGPRSTIPKHMVSEQEIQINRERVVAAITHVCRTWRVPFHYVYLHPIIRDWGKMPDVARDGTHPGPKTHRLIAEHFK